jgi:hypothetical protein
MCITQHIHIYTNVTMRRFTLVLLGAKAELLFLFKNSTLKWPPPLYSTFFPIHYSAHPTALHRINAVAGNALSNSTRLSTCTWAIRSLSYDMSIASSTVGSPDSTIKCFFYQVPVFPRFIMSSFSCLYLLPRLLVPALLPSITCFRRQFSLKNNSID